MGSVRLGILVAAMLATGPIMAGESQVMRIVGATPDGAFYAFWDTSAHCGLAKNTATPVGPRLEVQAVCQAQGSGDVLPLDKWTWPRSSPQISRLRPFREEKAWAVARIWEDPDTRVPFLQIHHGDAWVVVRVIEGPAPDIDGVLTSPGNFALRAHYFEHNLNDRDELWTVPQQELDQAPQRQEQARAEAREATLRMREHRKQGTGVFAPKPAGTKNDKWEQGRRHGIAKFVYRWEIAAAYGPLTASELQDALWLLGWFDSRPRRYQALRWYMGLLERDAHGAADVLEQLARDPDTRELADFLRSTRDPLWRLPGNEGPITDETLRPLSDEQLHWLHRWLWATGLGCRFSDPAVAAAFALRPSYQPVSEKRWRRMLKSAHGDPDALLHGGMELEVILREEHRRGIRPPSP